VGYRERNIRTRAQQKGASIRGSTLRLVRFRVGRVPTEPFSFRISRKRMGPGLFQTRIP
jgi:hypothetical protein